MELQFEFPDTDKGYVCSCCGLFVKSYKRHFNSNMGAAILFLYKNEHKGFIKVEAEMQAAGYKRCGDFPYLRHYGFIEPKKEIREDGSPRNGMYRISEEGKLFCEGKTTAKEYFHTFNNKCEKFSGEEISIVKALGNKFDYDKLMSNT